MRKRSDLYKDKNLALVVVDMQRKFTENTTGNTVQCSKDHVGVISDMAERFRSAGRHVIRVLYDGESHTPYFEGYDDPTPGLIIADDDVIVHKKHMNSYNDTDLAERIHSLGYDGIVLCGIFSHLCVLSTYFASYDNNISPYMYDGGLISIDEETTEHVLSITFSMTKDDIIEYLKK